MSSRAIDRPTGVRRRRWPLLLAYAALLVSCDSQLAPESQDIDRVEVSPNVAVLSPGGTQVVTARVYAAGGDEVTGRHVFWSAQNPAVATVTQSGIITAVGTGTTQVAASSGGRSGIVAVTVQQRPVALVRITPGASNVVVGATVKLLAEPLDATGAVLSGTPVTWSSSDAGVATVNNDGLVSGVAPGTVTIRAVAQGIEGAATITVFLAPVASIDLVPGVATVDVGGTQQLVATARDASGQPLTGRQFLWASDNPGVATVSNSGLVTGVATGTATITVSAPFAGPQGSTPSKTASITVMLPAVSRVQVSPATTSITVGQTANFTVTLFDANNQVLGTSGRLIAWSSSATAVATINSVSGTATGVGTGTTTITATVSTPGRPGSQQGTAALTVGSAPVATQITITTQPSATATNDVPFAQQPVLQLRDAAGNAFSQAGVAVTASIASGGGTLGGTVTVNTNASGVATFTNLKITGTVGARTLQFTSVHPAVTSAAVNVTPGVATQLVLTTAPPSSAVSGSALSPQPVLQLRDVSGNNVPQSGVAVIATLPAGAAASLSGATVGTDANGTATYTALTLTGSAGSYIVTFSAGALSAQSGAIALSAGTGSKLAIVTQPSATAQNGQAFTQQPSVQLLDASNNPVLQAGVAVTATIASGGGTLGGTATVNTTASGVATFTDLKITGTVGTRTLLFAAQGYVSVPSDPINITPGPAAALSITTQPSAAAQSGVVFAQQPVVQVVDVSGNLVGQAGVVVTAAIASGGPALGGTLTATTGASGAASFTDLMITGLVGDRTLSFTSAPSLAAATSGTISVSAGPAVSLAITTQPPASAVSGAPLSPQPVLQLRDVSGNNVPQSGVAVIATLPAGAAASLSGATVGTDANGTATYTALTLTGSAGSYVVTFSASALSVQSSAIALSAGTGSKLAIVTQPSPTAQNDSEFAQQPRVQLMDAANNSVSQSGVAVTASIASGGGTLGGTVTANTDASGVATFTNLKITGSVGTRTLQFDAPGYANVPSDPINITPGPAAALRITTPPSASAQSGVAFTQQPVVQVVDVSNNAVSQAGVVVTAAIASGGPALGGTLTAITGANGTASFTDLMITGLVGDRTLDFTSVPSLTKATSGTISVSAGPASSLAITTQPSASAQAGVPFPTQPVVQLRDASGNPVSQSGTVVTAAIATGGGSLGGTTTATTNGSGTAAFTDLQITGATGDHTIAFSATGLTPAVSNTVSVAASGASQLTITTQPSASATNDVPFAQQPVLQLRDPGGNPVSQAGVAVTAAVASGSGTIGGTATVNTDASGVATFADLKITGLVGNYTISFAASGLTGATSATISLAAGAASQLAITTQPSSSAANGAAFAQQPVLQLQDVSSNPVSQSGVSVAAAIASPGSGSLGGTTTVSTNASGSAAFTDLSITGTVGSYTLSFSAGTLSGATSSAITLTPGAPATVTVSAPGDSIIGTGTLQASATILDSGGNTVTGVAVAWSSDNAAVATVGAATGLVTGVTPGSATITATAGGQSDNLVVRVLASVALVEVSAPDSSAHPGQTVQATASLKDGNGNTLTGRPVSWSSSNPATASVDASTGLITAVAGGAVTITASVPAEGKSGTMPFTVLVVPADSVAVSPATASLTVGGTQAFTATAYDSTGAPLSGRTFTWGVSNPAKASITTAGVLTALDSGTVVVTATTTPGTSSGSASGTATATISLAPVGSVVLSPANRNIKQGNSNNFTVTVYAANGTTPLPGRSCTITSSNTNVATVAPSSAVTNSQGQFTVTATVLASAANGATSTITVTCDGVQGTATVTVN